MAKKRPQTVRVTVAKHREPDVSGAEFLVTLDHHKRIETLERQVRGLYASLSKSSTPYVTLEDQISLLKANGEAKTIFLKGTQGGKPVQLEFLLK